MVDIISPEIAPCVDAFLAENTLEITERTDAVLFPCTLTDTDDDLLLIILINIRVVRRHVR